MKKRLDSVSCFIAVVIVCLLASCGATGEKNSHRDDISTQDVTMYNEYQLEKAFESDMLTQEQLNLFQKRAEQKLADFVDYIGIISNKKYDTELRLAAKQQVEQLFADSLIGIEVGLAEAQQKERPLSVFIEEIYESGYDSILIKVLSVKTEKLEACPQMICKGYITAGVSIERYKNGKNVFSTMGTYTTETIIRKTQKQFGQDSSTVWTVALGKIKQVSVALP